jgi:hypothetical protein
VAPARPLVTPVPSGTTIPEATTVSIDDIRKPVAADMDQLVKNLTNVVGDRHPMLMAAAQQIFGAGGKKLRPMLVFLVAKATCQHTGRCGNSSSRLPSFVQALNSRPQSAENATQGDDRQSSPTGRDHGDDPHGIAGT